MTARPVTNFIRQTDTRQTDRQTKILLQFLSPRGPKRGEKKFQQSVSLVRKTSHDASDFQFSAGVVAKYCDQSLSEAIGGGGGCSPSPLTLDTCL